jgi:hypothetical protein
MTFSVKQLDGEPVVLITLDDTVDKPGIIAAYLQSVELATTIPDPVYRIIDLRHAPHCYPNIIAAVQEIVTSLVGAAVYPQMRIVFVGTPKMVTGYHAPGITFVSDIDTALTHIVRQ